ncbi:uncharacterized protein LOC128387800 [Panonychus citri]|uniref:uncharacterized protein LOC128387800 n=1 Tax=Panonychus citri TaxID=50023 RepID=UPI0023074CE4|nr:uncharacterized protein LOC128387800 [Panonychus citri]
MANVDLELKKHFKELQMKVGETRGKMRQIDTTIDILNRSSQRYRLTLSEVKNLPESITTYQSIGRMFVKTKKDEIESDLSDAIKSNTDKCQELEKNKVYLGKSLKEKEDSIRELISQKQSQLS